MATASLTTGPRRPSTRRLARHQVRDQVERMIHAGKIKPGQRLVQLRLSRSFGVSLGVIREALLDLQQAGLVETIDNHGMFVRRMDTQTVRELYLVREMFEGLAARQACGRVTPVHADELRRMAEEIHRLARAGKEREKAELDRAFHRRIVEHSGVKILAEMAGHYRVLGKVVSMPADPDLTRKWHLAVIDSLMGGDPAAAETTARLSVQVGLRSVEEALARGRGKAQWIA